MQNIGPFRSTVCSFYRSTWPIKCICILWYTCYIYILHIYIYINGLTPWCRRPPFGGPWLSDVMRCYPTCFQICHDCPWFSPGGPTEGFCVVMGRASCTFWNPLNGVWRLARRWQRTAAAGQRVRSDLGKQWQSGKGPQRGFVSWWAVLRARFETL